MRSNADGILTRILHNLACEKQSHVMVAIALYQRGPLEPCMLNTHAAVEPNYNIDMAYSFHFLALSPSRLVKCKIRVYCPWFKSGQNRPEPNRLANGKIGKIGVYCPWFKTGQNRFETNRLRKLGFTTAPGSAIGSNLVKISLNRFGWQKSGFTAPGSNLVKIDLKRIGREN